MKELSGFLRPKFWDALLAREPDEALTEIVGRVCAGPLSAPVDLAGMLFYSDLTSRQLDRLLEAYAEVSEPAEGTFWILAYRRPLRGRRFFPDASANFYRALAEKCAEELAALCPEDMERETDRAMFILTGARTVQCWSREHLGDYVSFEDLWVLSCAHHFPRKGLLSLDLNVPLHTFLYEPGPRNSPPVVPEPEARPPDAPNGKRPKEIRHGLFSSPDEKSAECSPLHTPGA